MTDFPPPPPPPQDPFSSNPPPPPPPEQGWYPPPPPGPAPFEQPPQYPPSYMPGYAPAYGAPAYAVPKRNNGPSLAALICGIVTFATCGLTAIPAVICGHIGLSQIKRDPTQDGRGMAIAGLVLGYLTFVGWFVFVVFAVAVSNDPAFSDF